MTERPKEKGTEFDIGTVLTITTGYLVSPFHVDGVYEILNYMTQDNLFTHQIPRATNECKPWLLRWYPELESCDTSILDLLKDGDSEDYRFHIINQFLIAQEKVFGRVLQVWPIPRDDHAVKNPIAELEEMVGKDKVIVVSLDDDLERGDAP